MNRGDRWLVVLPLVLTAFGVIMVYSSSAILGITRFQDPHHFLFKQLSRAAIGSVALLACMRISPRRLESSAPGLLGITLVMLALVAVTGHMSNGATRWLKLGVLTLQPTEFARLSAILFLAWWLKRRPPAELGLVRGLLPPLAIMGGISILILLQPNLSSAVLLVVTGFLLLFLAGTPLLHLTVPVAVAGLAGAIALHSYPYMMERVETYLRFVLTGALDARGSGWQLDQSLIAIGSGGWFGRGLGGGLQKYLFLPEAHTDFIFSILAEELGFLGATVLIVLIMLFVWRGLRLAARSHDPFVILAAGGLTIQIALYALVNLAVATGLAPTTGLPLPFVSYGGSALLANLAAAGLLYRMSAAQDSDEALVRERWSRKR